MKIRVVGGNYVDVRKGEIYDVEDETPTCYMIIDDVMDSNDISKKDCEVIEEGTSEWSSEGLPPIGTVCEVSINNQEPREVEIVAYFVKTRSVIIYEAPWTPEVYEWDDCKFRPIKSQKQKDIEELSKNLDNFVDDVDIQEPLEEYLYNLGYRKTK